MPIDFQPDSGIDFQPESAIDFKPEAEKASPQPKEATIGPQSAGTRFWHAVQSVAPDLISTEVERSGRPKGFIPNVFTALSTSPLHLPRVKTAPDASTIKKVAAGALDVGEGVAEFLTSPVGVSLGPVAKASKLAGFGMSTGYGAEMLTQGYQRIKEGIKDKDARTITEGALTLAGGGLAAKHAISTIPAVADILPRAAKAAKVAGVKVEEPAPTAAPPSAPPPGGSQEELPPEQQATSKANNAQAAWAEQIAQVKAKQAEIDAQTAKPPAEAKTPALDPQHQLLLDEAAKEGGHDVEVVQRELGPNEPFAGQIATVDRKTGKILINPHQLSGWLTSRGRGGVPEGQERAAIRSLLGEERIHLATPDESALAYHDAATGPERAIAQRVYGGATLSPTMLGHEMLRMRMQQLARMDVRETIEASTKERWTVKGLMAVSDAIRTVRQTLGTKASKEQLAILGRVQDNLDAVIAAKSGQEPSARRKTDKDTPEFFLPPAAGPLDRPTAEQSGALPEVKIPPEQALKTDTVLWNKPNAWRRVTNELITKPFSLGKMLTEGSRASETDPVSTTRRLVALEKGGKVDVVSVYPDAEDGARAVDPAYAGKRARPNVPIKALLDEGYRPIVSMLRTEAVQNFHRHFDSLEQFEQTVGQPGDQQWANVRGYEAQTAATQAPSFGRGNEMTDAEAGALHELFTSQDTVDKAVDAIAASPNVQQIRAAIGKAIHQIMADNKGLTREEAAGRAVTQLYEQARNTTDRNQFVKGALGRFGQESPEGAGQPGPETVNDLGQPQPAEEESAPAAIRKFAQDQVKLTEDDIKDYVSNRSIGDSLARTFDGARNMPNIVAGREEHGIRLQSVTKPALFSRERLTQWTRGNKDVLSAANALVQAKFDRSELAKFRGQVTKGIQEARNWIASGSWRQRRMGEAWLRSNGELLKELEYAESHWNDPELQRTARRMEQALDVQWTRERMAGFDVSKDDNYVPQRYDAAVWNEHSILFNAIEGSEKVLGGKFRKPKTFHTYYAAAAEGPYIPVTRDGATLVSHRVRQGMNLIERNAWSDGLKAVTMPNGDPVAMDAKFNAQGQLQPPASRNYENMMVSGKVLAVHEDVAPLVDNLVAHSKVENWPTVRAALRLEQQLKHGLLLGDFFHFGRMIYYAGSIMGAKARFEGGLSALDYKPQDLTEAVRRGAVKQSSADWANGRVKFGSALVTRRELAERFVRAGANLGKIQDALYKDLITDMTPAASPLRRGVQRVIDPSVGRYNRFLFDKFTRGLMTESNIREFERQSAANPGADPELLLRDISRDVNNYFGNIGKQGWMKSSTQKDLARLFLLAPDWLEGLIKKETTFAGRASGLSKVTGRREGVSNLGTTGRGIGRGLIFLLGLTQAMNLISRKQPTWQNEEKGHKFDAYVKLGDDEFWFSPLSVFNEITHDLWRYVQSDRTTLEAIDQVAGNKETPLARAVIIAGLGATGRLPKPTTSMGQLGMAAKAMAPVPLTFGKYAQAAGHAVAPSLVSPPAPGTMKRQMFSSLGLKVEPKLSAAQEVSRKAQDFAKENGFAKETGWQQVQTDEPSYSKLRAAIRSGDEKEAQRQYAALKSGGRTDKAIFHSMKLAKQRPFTGSAKGEHAFVRSLDETGLKNYFSALQQREVEYSHFLDFALRQ